MAVDWSNVAPQEAAPARAGNAPGTPPSLEPGASLSPAGAAPYDELLTERNSLRAEAALWQRRLMVMQQERDQARVDLRACDKSHAEWEKAYDDLLREFRRLEVRMQKIGFDYEAANSVVDFLIASRAHSDNPVG